MNRSDRATTPDVNPPTFEVRTDVTLRRNGAVVLTAATDEAGAYLTIPGGSISLPKEVLHFTLERAGIVVPQERMGLGALVGHSIR